MSLREPMQLLGGCVLTLCAWELIGRDRLLGSSFPALSVVLHVFVDVPRRHLLYRSLAATAVSATIGYFAGACLGAVSAVLAHLVPGLRGGLDRTAVLVNALPVIVLGPVLIITAGREDTPAALASIPVFFLLYTSTGAGLRAASQRLQWVLTAFGASRWQRLVKVEAVAALPQVTSGLKLATSTAMIGTIVGEWFGAPIGLGVVVLNSMENYQIALLWATVLVIALITLSGYGLLTLAERAARRRFGECDA
jgi:ABC-type nitrate/sulfonate/bicarbonate transport system permease component